MGGTLKMIADRTGLSSSTVSQILNRRPNDFSSEEARQRVFSVAREIGYKQKFGHKVLRGDKTHTVAILLSLHRVALEEHIQELVFMLLGKLERRNHTSYVITLGASEADNMERVRDLISRGVDRFVMVCPPHGERVLEEEILKNGREVIGFNTELRCNVYQGVAASTETVLRFFLDEGRDEFRVLLDDTPNSERLEGLSRLFPEQPLERLRERYVVDLGHLGETSDLDLFARIGYERTREVMAKEPSVRALYFMNDYFALGGVKYLAERGCAIGRDVAVGAFNDINAVRNHVHPISSGRHGLEAISDVLANEIEKSGELNQRIEPETIIRKWEKA